MPMPLLRVRKLHPWKWHRGQNSFEAVQLQLAFYNLVITTQYYMLRLQSASHCSTERPLVPYVCTSLATGEAVVDK